MLPRRSDLLVQQFKFAATGVIRKIPSHKISEGGQWPGFPQPPGRLMSCPATLMICMLFTGNTRLLTLSRHSKHLCPRSGLFVSSLNGTNRSAYTARSGSVMVRHHGVDHVRSARPHVGTKNGKSVQPALRCAVGGYGEEVIRHIDPAIASKDPRVVFSIAATRRSGL